MKRDLPHHTVAAAVALFLVAGSPITYVDRSTASNPSLRLRLKSGGAGQGKILVRAKGSALGLVPDNAGVFFSQSDDVAVILVGSNAPKCFRADFPRPWRKNLPSGYKDKD